MKIGDRMNVHFNGGQHSAMLVGTDDEGNAIVNGSPAFGQVPLVAETECPHPLRHAGDTERAHYTPAKETAEIKVPTSSVSSEPSFVPPAPKAPDQKAS